MEIELNELIKKAVFGDFIHLCSNDIEFAGWYIILNNNSRAGITTRNKMAWCSAIFYDEENIDKVIFTKELRATEVARFIHNPDDFEYYYIVTRKSKKEEQLENLINDLQNKLEEATRELKNIKNIV
jgi:hypothetical protein